MRIVDSHNHLHFPEFSSDLDSVLDRAEGEGVVSMLLVGIDPEDSLRAIRTAQCRSGLFSSVGIHPQMAGKYSPGDVLSLETPAAGPSTVAVGETGFDLYRSSETEDLQAELFRAHIELARRCSLPLVIHDRNAHSRTTALLDEEGAWSLGGVFHCFSGDTQLAGYVMDRGFFISVPGVVTFKNADVLKDVVRFCPLDSLLVETDAPFLAPVPYRGKRNEPSYLPRTIREIAAVKGCSEEKVAEATSVNFFRLFTRALRSPQSGVPGGER